MPKATPATPKPEFKQVTNRAPKRYKESKRLTIPLFSLAHTPFMMALVTGEMYEADMNIGAESDKLGKPTVCPVTNLDSEIDGLLICNEIVKSSLSKVEGGYVGRVFKFQAGDIRDGKRYRDIDIVLMEEES